MSASAAEGAFRGIRSKARSQSVAESSSPLASSPAPHDGNVPISKSRKRSAKLHQAATASRGKPQGILKREKTSPAKKNVQIKNQPEIHTFTSLTRANPSSQDLGNPPTNSGISSPTQLRNMGDENRPKLKLKLSNLKSSDKEQDVVQTPAAAPSSTPSLKLTFKKPGASTPSSAPKSTPAIAKPTKSKVGPSGSSSKKRKQPHGKDAESSADELAPQPQKIKKIRFLQRSQDAKSHHGSATTPTIKLKTKGKIPKRPLGVGYDSELSETENDPTLSEAFMFRMPPGEDCDYLQEAIEKGTIGLGVREGGADVRLQFFDRHGRRSMVTIRGRRYAASFVDLPCIIEGMKSWDKKGWIKSADISQMFLVLGRVETDEEAQNYPLPPDVDPNTWQYAHGVTPPMQHVRKRRFARTKRTSVSAIEAVERKVNQLFADDEAAESVRWEILDGDTYAREEYEREHSMRQSEDEDMDGYGEEEDAEGEDIEDDYFGRNGQVPGDLGTGGDDIEMDEDAVAAELEAHLMASEDEEEDEQNTSAGALPPVAAEHTQLASVAADGESFAMTSTSGSPSALTAAGTAAATPAAISAATTSDADEAEEESSDEDEADEEDISDDEAAAALREQREKIAELEESIRAEEAKFKGMQNPILRKKIQIQIGKLRADLEMTRRGAGEDEDGDPE
ncbi:putative transcription initiation factor tfiid subunit 7 [Phaeomoniella chlamydospora]|uniref:Putative transcription initiation factor tfiid subunit 7 n=1 Tax=Phaeomoniella chlamydospora TaxID=158046 RepID=A0A0G2ENZ1_PHACM|nr:putative transcription initiation factor tfiid subunit 7 [Phaeomoniella chlamydospora]